MFNFKKVVSIIVIFSFVLAACSSKQIQREQEELEEQERAEAKRQEQQPAGSISQLQLLPDDKRINEKLSKQAKELLEKYKRLGYSALLFQPEEEIERERQEEKQMEAELKPFTHQHPNIKISGVSFESISLKSLMYHIAPQELLVDKHIKLLEYAKLKMEVEAKMVELAQEWPMTQTEDMRRMANPETEHTPNKVRINEAMKNKMTAVDNSKYLKRNMESRQKRVKVLLSLAEKGLPGGEVEPVGMRDNAQREAITEQYLAQKYKELMEKWQKLEIGWGEVEEQEEKTLKALKSLKPADNGNQGPELLSPEKRVMNIKILESLADKEIKLLEFEEAAVEGAEALEAEIKLARRERRLVSQDSLNRLLAATETDWRELGAKENKNMAERVRDLLLTIEAAAAGEVEPDVAQKEKEIAQKKHELAIRWGEVKERMLKLRDNWM